MTNEIDDFLAIAEASPARRVVVNAAPRKTPRKLPKADQLELDGRNFWTGLGALAQELLAKIENPELSEVGTEGVSRAAIQAARSNEFVSDVRSKLYRFGSLSERQVEAVVKAAHRFQERLDRSANEVLAPVIEGTYVVMGKVLSETVKDSPYGPTHKMLVEVDTPLGIYRVWGSVPATLEGSYDDDGHFTYGVQSGDRVAFTASVERSQRDENFGFFKRPRGARISERANA